MYCQVGLYFLSKSCRTDHLELEIAIQVLSSENGKKGLRRDCEREGKELQNYT